LAEQSFSGDMNQPLESDQQASTFSTLDPLAYGDALKKTF
jgi:hypothetical protein